MSELTLEEVELLKEATEASRVQYPTDVNDGGITYLSLPFSDAASFVEFFDPQLRKGLKTLHKWQREDLILLSKKGRFTKDDPLRYLLCASNGSGKDWAIIGGFVAYVLCCWRRYKIVITSASHLQLDTQTRVYIKYLCEQVNSYLRENGIVDENVIDIKKETFSSVIFTRADGSKYTLTGSICISFVTDEAGRAEGHHPLPDADPGEGVILIMNEAKTIPDEIFGAFRRCTFNYWIEVSSPGKTGGQFYKAFCEAKPISEGHIKGFYLARKVTSYDCPHISPDKIALDARELGEESALFKSMHKAEFTNVDTKVVISDNAIKKCLLRDKVKIDIGQPRRAGLDLAGGGAECALYIYDNNIRVGKEVWKAKDTEITIDLLVGDKEHPGYLPAYGLKPENVYGDDNGIGQAIIDGLARRGWPIVRIRNQFKPLDSTRYRNRGAELWFRFARLVEEAIVDLDPEDIKLLTQLANRHIEQNQSTGQFKLLSKEEELANGYESPDRADALVLCFTGLTVMDFLASDVKKIKLAQNYPVSDNLTAQMNLVKAPRFYLEPYNIPSPEAESNKRLAYSNPINIQHYLYGNS